MDGILNYEHLRDIELSSVAIERINSLSEFVDTCRKTVSANNLIGIIKLTNVLKLRVVFEDLLGADIMDLDKKDLLKLDKIKLESIIRSKLISSKNQCEFKKAFIPDGFACVNIDKFAELLSEELAKAVKEV